MRFLAALLLAALLPAQPLKFRVRETAGLRRFAYPVRAAFQSGNAVSLQLLENGKPVAAQFTSMGTDETEIDFNASLGPYEAKEYTVVTGVPAPPEAAGGMRVEETAASYLVRHSNGLVFDVPKNLKGLLNAVNTARTGYLKPGSAGLALNYKDDFEYRAGGIGDGGVPTKGRIIKSGPLVCALRFEGEGLRGKRTVRSTVAMEFPRSKAWVEIRWTVDDPERLVSAMMADLNLNIEGEPALVDFGAGSYVYATLRKNQSATFEAGMPAAGRLFWSIRLNDDLYAGGLKSPVEGWAHVMDKQRATAVAVADFAELSSAHRDRIQVSGDGRLQIRRDWAAGGARTIAFWLHFVGMPVQVGAVTSPQSMQSPLSVEWQ